MVFAQNNSERFFRPIKRQFAYLLKLRVLVETVPRFQISASFSRFSSKFENYIGNGIAKVGLRFYIFYRRKFFALGFIFTHTG